MYCSFCCGVLHSLQIIQAMFLYVVFGEQCVKQGLGMKAVLTGVVFITAEPVQIPMSDAAILNNLTCVCIHVCEWICKGLLLQATTVRVLRRDQNVLK